MAGDTAHTRYLGLRIDGFQVFRIDAAYAAAVQFCLLGLSVDGDVAHAAASDADLVCQYLVEFETADAGVFHRQDIGVQTVKADRGGASIPDLCQIGGIDGDIHVLGIDVGILPGETDVEFVVLTVEVEEFDVVVGGREHHDAVLVVALYQLHIGHHAAGHLRERVELVFFFDDDVAGIDLIPKMTHVKMTRC